ncbi:MAG: aminotransferase class I/II-fold pyridoxal phosphate-dependent enzyme, partial [Clostridia bacterium]|nr:aminotransferase class I/II-fold pyridoxal phosphate-dependent enzyme [Clostridia bacterium]
MDYSRFLSRRVTSFKPSGIRKYFDLLNEMEDGISLGVGEPDFITPEPIRNAAIESIKNKQTKYTSNAGLFELREAIAKYQKQFIGVDYDPHDEIVVTVGASEALDIAMRTLLDPGDEIIILLPSYVCYEPDAQLANAVIKPIYLKAENKFRLTPEMIEEVVT